MVALRLRACAGFLIVLLTATGAFGARKDADIAERTQRRERDAARERAMDDHPWCATSEANNLRLERLERWVHARAEAGAARRDPIRPLSSHGLRYENGLFIMETRPATTPFDHIVDLANSSIDFTRTSATAFTVQTTALDYDANVGTLRRSFDYNWATEPYTISGFTFPFYGSNVTSIFIAASKGIFLTAPAATDLYQFSALEAATMRVPMIAPLLMTSDSYGTVGAYDLYVKETPTALVITWRTRSSSVYDEDIQVTLFSNGNIRFSYKKVASVEWGAVIVTSGAEGFYGAATSLLATSDAAGDASSLIAEPYRSMLDVQNIAVERISSSNLIEIRLTCGAAVSGAGLSSTARLEYFIEPGATTAEQNANSTAIRIYNNRVTLTTPQWGTVTGSPAVSVSGNTITVRILDEMLALASPATTLHLDTWFYAPGYTFGDQFDGAIAFVAPAQSVTTDLSSLTSPTPIASKPIIEAFTIPILNVSDVWSRLKAAYPTLSDNNVESVAIYQLFNTDLIFYAGGYSTVGNAGADGIAVPGRGISSTFPRRAALQHMGKFGRGWNASQNGIFHLLAHEFGHRWLYFIQIREGGSNTYGLNPDGGHPRQGAHLPAAFNVITATDSSAMGGAFFTQTGANTYRTPTQIGYYGYSWNELYLMGLASLAEITPWFYLTGTGLDSAYYPASNRTYTPASRGDVVGQQIVDAIGPRNPAYGAAPTEPKLLFVLLERPDSPATPAEIGEMNAMHRVAFANHFAAATGNRASLVTTLAASEPTASFDVSPAAPVAGSAVTFTDTSTGNPTSWSWSFDDGGTSTVQNPTHTYAAGGTFTVSLTVNNAAGSNSTTKNVVVTQAAPIADFSWIPAVPHEGQSVYFTDTSTGAPTSWSWTFGDGGTATVQNPSHTYAAAGTHTVTLITTNASGSDTVSKTVVVGPPIVVPRGDVDGDGAIGISDVFFLINSLFANGPPPIGSGDADNDGSVGVGDIFYLINHLFAGGPAPA